MDYRIGDYVFPTDLPRRVVCRVDQAECTRVPSGSAQVLRLAPLAGPWPHGTVLVRLSAAVMRVSASDLWQVSPPIASLGGHTQRHAA
jgi:hypothetical protein